MAPNPNVTSDKCRLVATKLQTFQKLNVLRFDVSEKHQVFKSIANHHMSMFGIYICKIFFDYIVKVYQKYILRIFSGIYHAMYYNPV